MLIIGLHARMLSQFFSLINDIRNGLKFELKKMCQCMFNKQLNFKQLFIACFNCHNFESVNGYLRGQRLFLVIDLAE